MIVYEWIQQLAATVDSKTVGASAQFHGGPLWYRPSEYGHSQRGTGCKPSVCDHQVCSGESGAVPAELRHDVLGHFQNLVPEYLQALSGKPEIPAAHRPHEGPGA